MTGNLYVNKAEVLVYKGDYNNIPKECIDKIYKHIQRGGIAQILTPNNYVFPIIRASLSAPTTTGKKKNILIYDIQTNRLIQISEDEAQDFTYMKSSGNIFDIRKNESKELQLFSKAAIIKISNIGQGVDLIVVLDYYATTNNILVIGSGAENIEIIKTQAQFGCTIRNNNTFTVNCEVL